MKKVTLIGSGINGLLLAALLSHDGYQVTVFEKKNRSGGRAFLYERDGFIFDNGLHITRFGPYSPVAKIMKYIGHETPYRKMGKSYLIDSKGRKVLFPESPMGFLTSDLFSLTGKLRVLRLMLCIKRGAFNHLEDITLKDWMIQQNIQGGIQRFFEILSASMMVCPFIEKTSTGEMFRILQRMLQKHIIWKRETSLEMVDGVQVNVHQTAKKRPSSRVPGVRNLFLVGDSIDAEGGWRGYW